MSSSTLRSRGSRTLGRYHSSVGVWVVLCAGWLALHAETLVRGATPSPNVLLIVSDDQAWTDYGFMRHPTIRTPHLDRLASESLLFTRGYVPHSLCRPSLMSILTGLNPHQHGIVGNDPPPKIPRQQMLDRVAAAATLPKLLAGRGYQSLQTGKWWEGNFKEGGFTHGMTHGDPQRRGRHGDEGLAIGREGLRPIFDFVDQCGDRPFFIWYAPMLPHSPHNPPERLLQKYRDAAPSPHVARYYAMCEWFDESIGELLTFLEMKKLSERTIVAYVTDNGWIQRPDGPQFAPRSKRSPYDGGVRTPIMLRRPGTIVPRRDEQSLARSIDLFPTILAACGVPTPPGLPGVNLLAENINPARREIVFGETYAHDVADLNVPEASLEHRWCVTDEWKLILPFPKGPAELFRIQMDPHEQENVAAANSAVVDRLTARLNAWWNPQRP